MCSDATYFPTTETTDKSIFATILLLRTSFNNDDCIDYIAFMFCFVNVFLYFVYIIVFLSVLPFGIINDNNACKNIFFK